MNKFFVWYGAGLAIFLIYLNASKIRIFDGSGFGSGGGGYGGYRSYGGGGYHK